MYNFLAKLFIKNWQDAEDPHVRQGYGKVAGTVGICTNLLLCAAKITIGLLSASISIIADGINNLADASSSVLTLIGFKLTAKPADKVHPYGHARYEYLTGLFISVLIMVVGILLLKSSIEKIIYPEDLTVTITTIIVLAISILLKLWQSFFYIFMGRSIDSLTLKAAAVDSRNDVITTAVVLIGVVIARYSEIVLDGYLGVLVAVFIIWSGIQLVRETASPLLGESPSEELVGKIASIAKEKPKVLGIHDLMVHNYGPGKIFASMHIEVSADEDFMASHDMVDNIEREISEKLKIHFVAHMDPVLTGDPLLLEISNVISLTMEQFHEALDFHDLRIVPGPTHSKILFDLVVREIGPLREEAITMAMSTAIKERCPNCYVVITFDKAYTHI